MIISGIAGTLYSVFDLTRGRGVIVKTIRSDSPLRQAHVVAGDAIWRAAGRCVHSIVDIDAALKAAPTDTAFAVSVISRGEHVERTGVLLMDALKRQESLSGHYR